MSKHRNFSRNNNNNGKYRNNNNGKKNGSKYANPHQVLQKSKQAKDKYLTMAREALASGDRIEAENYFQHADHYTRIINSLSRERVVETHDEAPIAVAEVAEAVADIAITEEVLENAAALTVEAGEAVCDKVVEEYQPYNQKNVEELVPVDV